MPRVTPRALLPLLLTASLLAPHVARADAAAAEILFQDGRKLLAEGRTAAACEKFAASQKLDPSAGTLLNLADCQLKQNRIASAWATFLSASTLARSQGNAGRAAEATKRAADLEPKLSFLTFQFAARPPGLVIKRDDVVLDAAALDSRLPVDPGTHSLVASAPGYRDWTSSIDVTAPGVREVPVPVLTRLPPTAASSAAPAPTAPATAPATTTAPTSAPTETPAAGRSPTVGYVVGAGGLVLLGVGAIFGVKSLGSYKDAEDLCPSHKNCNESARGPRDDASSQGTLATIGIGLGVVGVAVGTILVLTSRKTSTSETAGWSLSPILTPGWQGASVGGRF